MANVAMILKRYPYGDINAAEAVRHVLGAASSEMNVDLILVDGGVLLAKKGQDDTGTGFTNLEGALKDCLDMGAAVYADVASLKAQGVASNDLVESVKLVGAKEIAGLLKEAKSTMIFWKEPDMIVMIKSAPDTTDGARGLTLAKEGGADLVLLQNGVYFARKERIGNFPGTVYVLDDDKRLRGLKDSEVDGRAKTIDYDTLTDIITGGDKVVGMF